MARKLNEGIVRRAIGSHKDRKSRHALSSDQRDLYALVVVAPRNDGGESAYGKIGVINSPIAHFHLVSDRQIDRFQVGANQVHVIAREASEEAIGRRIRGG